MFQFVQDLKNLKERKDISRNEAAKIMAEIKLPFFLAAISQQTTWLVVGGMWLGATFCALGFVRLVDQSVSSSNQWLMTALYSFAPVVFALAFVLIGSFFARIGRPGMMAGKFPRSPDHPIYALRRIFGTAWTQVFYFKPLYAVFLSIPFLKGMLFKLFGYRGQTDFVLYPDAWVRDLPLLSMGKGAYLANRCTIGSNICLTDGSILVGSCQFGEKALVGHLVIFGLGGKLGRESELGIAVSLGIRITIGDLVSVAPKASIYHGAEIGNNVKIGACALVGMKAKIADGVELKVAAIIPNGAVVSNQTEADQYFSSELEILKSRKDDLTEILRKNLDEFSGSAAR